MKSAAEEEEQMITKSGEKLENIIELEENFLQNFYLKSVTHIRFELLKIELGRSN
jgi:hypothetical protein